MGFRIILNRIPKMRMETRERDGIHWVNDAYNANPDSMRVGIECFTELTDRVPAEKRVVVLGDMLELEPYDAAEHESLVAWAVEALPAARLIAVGTRLEKPAARRGIRAFPTAAAARQYLAGCVKPGDWVLLKGSRGMRLETMLPWATA